MAWRSRRGIRGGFNTRGATVGISAGGGSAVGAAAAVRTGGTVKSKSEAMAADEKGLGVGSGSASDKESAGAGFQSNFATKQEGLDAEFAGATGSQNGAGGRSQTQT